jgi:hypothetical protein
MMKSHRRIKIFLNSLRRPIIRQKSAPSFKKASELKVHLENPGKIIKNKWHIFKFQGIPTANARISRLIITGFG